jgi:hypothetical protein
MGLRATFFHNVAQLIVERPGRKRSLAEWAARLEETLGPILAKAEGAGNPAAAGAALRHIIGIERWGQSRLAVFLGESLKQDEYDSYAPSASLDVAALRDELRSCRADTIDLARRIDTAGVSLEATVPHNDFGPLTARGWLAYLNDHASREAMRIR